MRTLVVEILLNRSVRGKAVYLEISFQRVLLQLCHCSEPFKKLERRYHRQQPGLTDFHTVMSMDVPATVGAGGETVSV